VERIFEYKIMLQPRRSATSIKSSQLGIKLERRKHVARAHSTIPLEFQRRKTSLEISLSRIMRDSRASRGSRLRWLKPTWSRIPLNRG